ncbi:MULTISPECIES: phage capsid protein [Calothrix]|uniref:Major capsid protein n=2 Tax=Calothrix TaxID=1186 RepID=A0ABR8AK49_9CYAN|nr:MULTISPECIES: phage capsid protein [Calothrix]MBD2200154.1 hypothetical protein [Calothrix parietina FACHB-288]MBD2229136.1 hypothetical protein [Calothrix anomala FACHB-343]
MPFSNTNNSTYNLQGQLRGSAVTKTRADAFIPEVWTGEVKRALDQKLVASKYVKMLPVSGKKGDRFHIPNIGRAAVYDKLPETPVTLQSRQESDWFIDIDKYKESSFTIEDIVGVQAAYELRSEYTREAGYALARGLDADVLALRAALQGYNSQSQVIYNTADGTLSGNSAPLNYQALLTAKVILDRADVPEEDRVLLVSPTQYNQLLAVDKFISMDYSKGMPVVSGVVGTIFGVPVIMTSQIGQNGTTTYSNGDGNIVPSPGVTGSPFLPTQDTWSTLPTAFTGSNTGAAAQVHTAILCQRDWAVLAKQMEPKVESGREIQLQSDVLVNTQLYGAKLYRPGNAVILHTNAVLPAIS